jgi:hypothetical protein
MFTHLKLLWIFVLIAPVASLAADEPPAPANAVLSERAEQITKRAMRVMKEEDGEVSLTLLPNGGSLANKTQIVFFRRKRDRVEVIANGVVTGERKDAKGGGAILVDIDRDTIIKYPESGDYAVPMSDPNADGAGDKKDQYDYLVPEEPKVKTRNDRPGYLEYGMGVMFGTLNSTPSSQANDALATSGYRFKNTHLAYYSDFFPIGFEMDSHSGNFPTSTFLKTVVVSSESVSNTTFGYRFAPFFSKRLEPVIKVNLLTDNFTTNNPTSDILSTNTSGMGFGLTLNYNAVSPVWKPEKAKIGFAFQRLFGEFFYFPSITAVDQGLATRGTSSAGSTGMQYRIGFTSLAYLGFIPFIKRFVIQGSYGARLYKLKFQGATTINTAVDTNPIPQGNTASSSESDFRFFVGIRFGDPIGLIFDKDKN